MKKVIKYTAIGCAPFLIIGAVFFSLLVVILGGGAAEEATSFTPVTAQDIVAKEILDYGLAHGATTEGMCAWLGNLQAESGLDPSRVQSDLEFNETTALNASLGGYGLGIAQWDKGRRVNLLNYATTQQKSWTDLNVQLDFAWTNDDSDSTLIQRLVRQSDVESTAVDILKYWERAGTKDDIIEQTMRKQLANVWYQRIKNGGLETGVGGQSAEVPEVYKDLINPPPDERALRLGYPGNGYVAGQCTWYIYNRFAQLGYQCYTYLGNGGNWKDTAISNGQKTDTTPHKYWAICFPPNSMAGIGDYGHVGFIEAVFSDGSVLISEMNYGGEYNMNWRVINQSTIQTAGLVFISPK